MNFKEWWSTKTGFKDISLPTPEKLAEAAWDFQVRELAKSQAREKVLQECLSRVETSMLIQYNGNPVYCLSLHDKRECENTLSKTYDDTILKAMLAKERERYVTVGNMLRNAYIEHGIPENELVFCVATVTDYQNAIHALGNE